jgi:uncharacterized SAM-binding protein YcdF (DUF218 family)
MDIEQAAQTIWDYMLLNQPLKKCDAILTLCSIDERVAEYSADLFLRGYSELLIFSGGVAHSNDLLKVQWEGTEADHFAQIALDKGVPRKNILIENHATNTGENIQFTRDLLETNNKHITSLLLVQKPYMERRTYATFKAQWPDKYTDIVVTSPPITFEEYTIEANPKDLTLNIMVGDLQRIKEYPKLGFQIEQDIPGEVWQAYECLVNQGYDKHLINC